LPLRFFFEFLEFVDRLRGRLDDIDETLWSVMYFNDVIALTAFTVVGLTIMMSINAWITLAVLLPLALIVVVTQRVAERIEQYRKASREATGAVTGFLGEIFGATLAVQTSEFVGIRVPFPSTASPDVTDSSVVSTWISMPRAVSSRAA